ncbi:MAG: precorrin-6y C5,15-methyltransferase (decarboxylating) subunit CbiE [Thermaerobacter sp.]|jgi:precorrin-6y C5,15-methyltransferase (decarboxylating) CbiE subunit|nr:precorrin-6y C5,15-methyltransferase (decarboxylating) subunit CbiE [Thermaerobacter sp.]
MEPMVVAGIGPGASDYLTPAVVQAVARAEVLVGGRRALALFPDIAARRVLIDRDLEGLVRELRRVRERRVVVLCSGDPGLFGLLAFLRRHFAGEELRVLPGISAVQLAFARAALPWHDARIFSLHGREAGDTLRQIAACHKAAVLGEPRYPPARLGEELSAAGCGPRRVFLGFDLGGEGERCGQGGMEVLAAEPEGGNYVAVIWRE